MEGFTSEEKNLLRRLLAEGRWDELWWELAILTPCFLFVCAGVWTGDRAWAVAGITIYALFRMRMIVYRAKYIPVWQALVIKLGVEEVIRKVPRGSTADHGGNAVEKP